MNKRGVLGKISVTFPVLILVFIVISIFLILSSGAVLFTEKESVPTVVFRQSNEDFLLEKVLFGDKEEFIFDLIAANAKKGDLRSYGWRTANHDFLDVFMEENEGCLFLFEDNFRGQDLIYNCYWVKNSQGVGSCVQEDAETLIFYYLSEASKVSFSVTDFEGSDRNVNLVYYYGECLHE